MQVTARRFIVVFFAASIFATSVQADLIVQWDMEAPANADKAIASFVDSGVSTTNLTGSNLNAPTSLILTGADPSDNYIAWSRNLGNGNPDLASAISDETFFSFTITPNAGQMLTIDNISFDAFAGTAGPSNRSFFLLSDKSGFTSNDSLLSGNTETGSPLLPFNTATADQNFLVDLSGNSLFTDITDSVTFRVYLRTPTTNQNIAFDDITVNGVLAAVPEPSSFTLFGLSAVFLLRRRRARIN